MTFQRLGVALFVAVIGTALDAQNDSRPASAPAAEAIAFELALPAAESRPAESRAPRPVAVIRITNKSAAPVILWPFVSLRIRDAAGEDQKPSTNRGRFGRRSQACFLEAIGFTRLAPGKSVEWPVRLDQYMHDPSSILGWKLKPGKYTIAASWAHSRADFVARCKLGCESHADPRRAWNEALEVHRDASLEIVVK